MGAVEIGGVEIAAVFAALPSGEVDNLEALSRLCPEKAESIVKTSGVRRRRVAAPGVAPVDLCVAAARRALDETGTGDVAAVVFVSFTSPARMPCAAAVAQSMLGLGASTAAFDISLACSGYVYALSVAAMFAQRAGGSVLLLDGDVQSAFSDPADVATAAVLADGGSATIVRPSAGAAPWKFSFATFGSQGDALRLGSDGKIKMDGFGVFRFVAGEVTDRLRAFLGEIGEPPGSFDAFVPHQPNAYMVRELARSVGFEQERTWLSCDGVGNMSSASIPVAIALNAPSRLGGRGGRLALCGFGGGLSIASAAVEIGGGCRFGTVEHGK